MSRFGLAVRRWAGKKRDFGSNPLQLSFLFKKVVVCGHCLVTLSLTINETLKWLSSLPTLMQKSFWWRQCSGRYIISLCPHLHAPFPIFSPPLTSLMVSLDVKAPCLLTCELWGTRGGGGGGGGGRGGLEGAIATDVYGVTMRYKL